MSLEVLRRVHLTAIQLPSTAPEPIDGMVEGLAFQVLPLGTIETMDGRRLRVSESDAKALLADFNARKNDLAVLYEHGDDVTKGMEAAGWISGFELRADGIWATSIRWTADAYTLIKAGKRRYISPSVICSVDGEGFKRPKRFVEITVTNTPAIDGMQPLAASRRKENPMALPAEILKALRLSTDASDEEVLAAITKLEEKKSAGAKDENTELKASVDAIRAELEASKKAAKVQPLIEEALKDGRITAANRPHFEKLANADPDGFAALVKELPKPESRVSLVRDRADATGAGAKAQGDAIDKLNRACRYAARFGGSVADAVAQLESLGWPEGDPEQFGDIRRRGLQGQDGVADWQDRFRWLAKSKTIEMKISPDAFAAISNYQPSTRALLPTGLGYMQAEFIGSILAPEIIATPDGNEQASYPKLGKEHMELLDDDLVAVSGEVKEADRGVTWEPVTLDMRGRKVFVDPRELRAGGAVNLNVAAQKIDLARGKVALNKENKVATLFTTSGNYASASHYATLSSTGQWSHASSLPIAAITDKDEVLRALHGKRPETFWASPTAFTKLRFHSTVTDLIKYSGTQGKPGAPASIEMIAALLNKNVLVGEAVKATASGGALSDVWNDCAGLTYVNPGALFAPRFALTPTSAGFPKTVSYRSDERGGEGSDAYKYLEMYKVVAVLNTAGYLWIDVTA